MAHSNFLSGERCETRKKSTPEMLSETLEAKPKDRRSKIIMEKQEILDDIDRGMKSTEIDTEGMRTHSLNNFLKSK